jgi:hypothetical protein
MQQEGVDREQGRHGPVGCLVHGDQFVPRDARDVLEKVDPAAECAITERGHRNIAKRQMVNAGYLAGGLG